MLITLPNGLQVEAIEPLEAQALYREIYEMGVYNGHGICIHEGDTVVDVGANIGLFSILMLQSAPHLQLFAVEPVPLLYDLLRNNLKRYAGESHVELLPVALAAQSGEAEFIYTPHSTMTSRLASAQTKSDASMGEIVHAGLTDLAQIYPERRRMYERFQRLMPVPLVGGAVTLGLLAAYAIPVARNRLLTRRIQCPMLTLSQVIEQHQIKSIDLLKIDVEGSEYEVLCGIAEHDWQRIRQLVLEVHDIDDRVNKVRSLLVARGFQTYVEQEDWAILRLMHSYSIFAIRESIREEAHATA